MDILIVARHEDAHTDSAAHIKQASKQFEIPIKMITKGLRKQLLFRYTGKQYGSLGQLSKTFSINPESASSSIPLQQPAS